jgi:hypothetical protein
MSRADNGEHRPMLGLLRRQREGRPARHKRLAQVLGTNRSYGPEFSHVGAVAESFRRP